MIYMASIIIPIVIYANYMWYNPRNNSIYAPKRLWSSIGHRMKIGASNIIYTIGQRIINYVERILTEYNKNQ